MSPEDRMTELTTLETALHERVVAIIQAAHAQVARTVNTAMVLAYWYVGREVVEVEQHGQDRAQYGARVIERLAVRLTRQFGRGYGVATLRRVRSFYLLYPEGSAVPVELGGPDKLSMSPQTRGGPRAWDS
jgi:hypothetical protein